MKAHITSTVVEIPALTGERPMARVWEGVTENGIPFVAYIPLIQVRRTEDNAEFEHDLQEHKRPEPETVRAIDARFVL